MHAMALLSLAVFLADAPSTAEAIAPTPWRTSDDVIDGWDWSLPPGVKPAPYSGVRYWDKANRPFAGNRYVSVRTSWRECEPTEGTYSWDRLRRKLANLPDWARGVELHVYASVWETKYFTDRSATAVKRTTPGTAPEWLLKRHHVPICPEKPKTNLNTPFQVVNLDIWHPAYHSRYLQFVRAFGQSGVARDDKVLIAYVHGRSASRGEESGSRFKGRALQCVKERLAAWAEAFKGVEYKMAWVGNRGEILRYAYKLGMGQRNGFVEMYLMHCDNPDLGQRIDKDGYLVVDESCPPIRDGRAFGDENEEYAKRVHVPRFGPIEGWPHRYRESMLRTLQMRRNFVWAEGNPWVDTPLLGYVGLELGRNVTNTPDVWCRLRESVVGTRRRPRPVKNFERWLYQRDRKGYQTRPVVKIDVPKQLFCHNPDHKYDFSARRTDLASGNDRIGFAVDDRFLFAGPHRVAVKVTYHDVGQARMTLAYRTSHGVAVRHAGCRDTKRVKTATFFLPDACFPGKGMAFDFELRAAGVDAVVSFVRVVKCDPRRREGQ